VGRLYSEAHTEKEDTPEKKRRRRLGIMSKGEPIPYDDALRIAKRHLIQIGLMDSTEKIAIVGSLRRKEKEVGDIDYQIITTSMTDIEHYFWSKDWECHSSGNKRAIFISPSGIYINVFNTKNIYWGAALMHNTGPSRYNIRKRYLIKKKGGILNQYGLYMSNVEIDGVGVDEDGYTLVASKTEQDIYDALGWTYCKPEDRE
jgi:DNA polymerase/3'-5' exonuclease PolX